MIYLISVPQNKLEEKGRVAGWRFVPWERDSKKKLRDLCQPLKDKHVTCIYSSDLDEDAGRIVASELHCEHRADFGLRRFNAGRNHGAKANYYESVLERVIEQWAGNPSVPVRGGDSWVSVEKRLFKAMDKIMAKDGDLVLVTDAHTATLLRDRKPGALVANGNGTQPGKVFVVKKS